MCVEIVIVRRNRAPEYISGLPELRRALGWRPPILPGYGVIDMNRPTCLCPVDLHRLARMAGWRYTPPDYNNARRHSREHLFEEAASHE